MKQNRSMINDDDLFVPMTKIAKKEDNDNAIIKIEPVFIQNCILTLIFKTIFQIISNILIVLFFLSSRPNQQNLGLQLNVQNSVITNNIQILFFLLSFLISISFIARILSNCSISKQPSKSVPLLGKNANKILYLLVEANISISSLLFLFTGIPHSVKFANLMVTVCISMFMEGLMQCTSKPADLLYTQNPLFILLLRIGFLLTICASIVSLVYNIDRSVIIVPAILFTIIIYYQYTKSGYRTYRNPVSKLCLLLIVTFFISTSIVIAVYQFVNCSLINYLYTIISAFITLYCIVQNKSNIQISQKNYGIDDIDQLIFSFQNFAQKNKTDGKCFLLGLLHQHKSVKCNNVYCYSHKATVFCSDLQADININNGLLYESMVRYFIKCQFEDLIAKQAENCEVLLRYCEFAYHEMKNTLPLALYLYRLERKQLSIYQRIRIYQLKKNLRNDTRKINTINPNTQLPFQKVIYYHQISNHIIKQNFQIIQRNIKLWEQLSQPNVCIEKMLEEVQKIDNNRLLLQTYWRQLEKYFHIWPKIQQHFAFYALFIENAFKKEKKIRKLEKILKNSSGQVSKSMSTINPSSSFSQEDVFKENSMIIHAFLAKDKLLIKRCSKSIKQVLGYDREELLHCNLEIVMPQFFREYHSHRFTHWMMDQGLANLERFQKGVNAFCLDKFNHLCSIIKTFKLFITENSETEFVCLLKADHIRANSVVCNNELLIEQSTKQFDQTFKIKTSQNLPLSWFIPNIEQIMKQFQSISIGLNSCNFCIKIDRLPYRIQISRINYGAQKVLITLKSNTIVENCKKFLSEEFETKIQQEQLDQRTFHKLLSTQQHRFSNIFMKEECFIAKRNMTEMRWIKYTLHSFFITLIFIFLAMMVISNSNFESLKGYINQHLTLLNASRQPYFIGINYNLMKINIEIDEEKVERSSDMLLELVETDVFRQTIFNSNFFPKQSLNNSNKIENEGGSDVFYTISSSIASLRSGTRNFSSVDYLNFNTLLFPKFYYLIDHAKDHIYEVYSSLYSNISVPNLMLLEFQSALFVLMMVPITLSFFSLCKKMKDIFSIIINVDAKEVDRIKRYYNTLKSNYSHIESLMMSQQDKFVIENYNIPKRQVESGNKLKKKERCLFATIVFSLSVKFLITAALLLVSSELLADLEQFGNTGIFYFDYFPSNMVITYGLTQKYFDQSSLNISQPIFDQYKDVIRQFNQVLSFPYMAESLEASSPFYNALKNYYFGNPCLYNPSILFDLNITIQQCITEGKLSSGFVQFRKSAKTQIENYLKGSTSFSKTQIAFYAKWMNVVSTYVEDLISIWMNEYKNRAQYTRNASIYMYALMSVFIILIHYMIAHKRFILQISLYYERYIKAYEMLATSDTMAKNKIIKSELISLGFINE